MGKEKDEERRRKKSAAAVDKNVALAAAAHALLDKDPGYATGYETDGGASSSTNRKRIKLKKRAKTQGGEAGYETDDGYMSSSQPKSKSKFFRLGNKSKTSVHQDENSRGNASVDKEPPVPPLPQPVFRLPIAERFATTLGNLNAGATADPPLTPPVRPFAQYTSSSPTSASASISSIPTPRDTDHDSIGASESGPFAQDAFATSKAPGVRFASSDSSDHHGSSSTSYSFLNKFASSSSSPTSSSNSHSKIPTISFPLTRSPSPPSPPAQHIPNFGFEQHQVTGKPGAKHVPDPLSLTPDTHDVNGQSSTYPSPSASSPFVVVTPIDTSAPPLPEPASKSSPRSSSRHRNRFFGRNKSEEKSSPKKSKPTITIPLLDTPHTQPELSAESPGHTRGAASQTSQLTIVPSTDFIIPSPRTTSHPSPSPALDPPPRNFSYYELPPPSPPPDGPLPKVPAHLAGQSSESRGTFSTQQQQRRPQQPFLSSRDPSPNRPDIGRSTSPMGGTPRRGREAPFPTQPTLNSSTSSNGHAHRTKSVVGSGFEARVKVARYRDLYAPLLPGGESGSRAPSPNPYAPNSDSNSGPDPFAQGAYSGAAGRGRRLGRQSAQVDINVEQPSDNEDDEAYGGYEYEDDQMHDVLGRYAGNSSDVGHGRTARFAQQDEPAIGRSRSYEELNARFMEAAIGGKVLGRGGHVLAPRAPNAQESGWHSDGDDDDDDKSHYPAEERTAGAATMYAFDNGSAGNFTRASRADSMWDDSDAGSRSSFMDHTKSEATRERFVQRIEAMFDESGREKLTGVRLGEIPPVPRLPKGLVGQQSVSSKTTKLEGWF